MPRAVQITPETFSNSKAKLRLAMPAKMTCQAVALKGSEAVCHFLESTEPSAQLNEPACNASNHHSSRRPIELDAISLGQMRTTTPAIPSNNPIFPRREM